MNKQRIAYTPQGSVCSKLMIIDLEGEQIKQVQIVGGCDGNTKGLCRLLTDMNCEDAISRLEGIDCKMRGTSCPDQLAKALQQRER